MRSTKASTLPLTSTAMAFAPSLPEVSMKPYSRSRNVIMSPGNTGISELSAGIWAAAWGMTMGVSMAMPLSRASSSVITFVVDAGYIRARAFFENNTSPLVASTSIADWAYRCPSFSIWGTFLL